MKSEMVLKRDGGSLRPDGNQSWEIMDKIANGSRVVVTVRKSRNPDALKKYWALCRACAAFHPKYHDADEVDHWVRDSIPWMREEIELGDGKYRVRHKPINMDEMEDIEFSRFLDAAIEVMSMAIGGDIEQLSLQAKEGAA
jgi:hypothetical protein